MEQGERIKQGVKNKVEKYVRAAFKVFFMVIVAILFALLVGYIVMWLWNWLMPDLFGLSTINYWQAVGILFLSKLFFGFGTSGPGKSRRKFNYKVRSKKWDSRKRDFSEWTHYEAFWKEEGEKAYKEYVDRIQNSEN